MQHDTPLSRLRIATLISLATGLALLTGCAQQRPANYYEAPVESSLTDARNQAQGRHGTRAPSQLQIGFGDSQVADNAPLAEQANAQSQSPAAAAPARAIRPLMNAKTFLGTIPCMEANQVCPASRVTLTLAPSGQWRSRTELLGSDSTAQAITQQGCWDVSSTQPLRIVLLNDNDTANAGFTFVNDNVLRVSMYHGIQPKLEYHLTRQPDIDPIQELDGQAARLCQ